MFILFLLFGQAIETMGPATKPNAISYALYDLNMYTIFVLFFSLSLSIYIYQVSTTHNTRYIC